MMMVAREDKKKSISHVVFAVKNELVMLAEILSNKREILKPADSMVFKIETSPPLVR